MRMAAGPLRQGPGHSGSSGVLPVLPVSAVSVKVGETQGKMGHREYIGGGALFLPLHWPLLISKSCSVPGGVTAGWRTFC